MVESEDVKKAEIDRLYKENVSKVYRTALYYVEDHYVAEEIVQEVFLKLYDNLGDICMESVPAWLITTAKNMAKNYLRDSKWETPMEEVPDAGGAIFVRRTGCSTHRSISPERMPRATRYDLCRSI